MKALAGALLAGTLAVAASAGSAFAAPPAAKHTTAGTKAAKASLLTLKDLGQGWQAGQAGTPGLKLGCTGWRPSGSGIVETGAAGTPAFAGGSVGPFLSQTASTYATAKQAATYWARAVQPGLVKCVVQTVQALEAQGVKVTITHQGALPVSKAAQLTSAFRVVASLSAGSKQPEKLYFDVILVGQGKTLTEISLSSFVAPIPAEVENALATLVAHRLSGGLPTA